MRKILSYALLASSTLVAASYTGGCNAAAVAMSECDSACLDYNALHCGIQCNCQACSVAPPACDSYFSCIQQNGQNCISVLACSVPPQCQAYVNANCH
jgi:hypothetical protein